MPMMTKKILDIQFLRGIAIILVMISHLSYIQDNWIASYRIFPGWIGVDLFFVISGFVVIRSFEGIDFDTRAFVLRRIFRIYPAIIVILLFCLITNLILPLISNEAALSVFHIPETRLLKQSFAI